jgi:hypothetical protein
MQQIFYEYGKFTVRNLRLNGRDKKIRDFFPVIFRIHGKIHPIKKTRPVSVNKYKLARAG